MKPNAYYIKHLVWKQAETTTMAIRHLVFGLEQGIANDLLRDESDASAQHFLLYLKQQENPVGSARLLSDGRIGRVAIFSEYRGKQLGLALMNYLHDVAREQGIQATTLHAQQNSLPFYQKLGYIAQGELFEEAGIPHIAMRLELPSRYSDIEFLPEISNTSEPLTIIKAREVSSYQPRAPRPSHKDQQDEPDRIAMLSNRQQVSDCISTLIQHSSEYLCIYSPRLPPELFGENQVLEAISTLARRNPTSKIHILVDDASQLISRHHPLLQLQQRLSSSIELKVSSVHYPINSLGMLLSDHRGWLEVVDVTPVTIMGNFHQPGKNRQLQQLFDQAWNKASVPSSLRQLNL